MRARFVRPAATAVSFASLVLLAGASGGLQGCGACEPARVEAFDAAPSVVSSGSATSAASSSPRALRRTPPVEAWRPKCRAIALEGAVTVEPAGGDGADAGLGAETGTDTPTDTRVALQAEVPSDRWLRLAAGARLVAKDPRTTRETTFVGPGRVRVCAEGREESWLAEGTFESTTGAGEVPGAEEWVVTPLGVVRYGAARMRAIVKATEVRVSIVTGSAFFWAANNVHVEQHALEDGGAPVDAGVRRSGAISRTPESPARPALTDSVAPLARGEGNDGWQRAGIGTLMVTQGRSRSSYFEVRRLADQCAAFASRTRELASAMLSDAAPPDAGIAADQVTTRRLAHAACAVAGLRARLLGGAEGASFTDRLTDAEAAWSLLPTAADAPRSH